MQLFCNQLNQVQFLDWALEKVIPFLGSATPLHSLWSELALIIAIFTIFNLNIIKHLNFLDFSKAFRLYECAKSTSTFEIFFRKPVEAENLSIKESMNKKESCFICL